MNRRGFFGTIAGAFVGGVFRRLAPAPVPTPLTRTDFYALAIAEMQAAVDRVRKQMVAVACAQIQASLPVRGP